MKDLVDSKDKKWVSYCITHDITSIPVSAMVASIGADTPSIAITSREGILPNTQPVTQENQERNACSYKLSLSLSKQESHGGRTVFPQPHRSALSRT